MSVPNFDNLTAASSEQPLMVVNLQPEAEPKLIVYPPVLVGHFKKAATIAALYPIDPEFAAPPDAQLSLSEVVRYTVPPLEMPKNDDELTDDILQGYYDHYERLSRRPNPVTGRLEHNPERKLKEVQYIWKTMKRATEALVGMKDIKAVEEKETLVASQVLRYIHGRLDIGRFTLPVPIDLPDTPES